jgi:hypothetical protein
MAADLDLMPGLRALRICGQCWPFKPSALGDVFESPGISSGAGKRPRTGNVLSRHKRPSRASGELLICQRRTRCKKRWHFAPCPPRRPVPFSPADCYATIRIYPQAGHLFA